MLPVPPTVALLPLPLGDERREAAVSLVGRVAFLARKESQRAVKARDGSKPTRRSTILVLVVVSSQSKAKSANAIGEESQEGRSESCARAPARGARAPESQRHVICDYRHTQSHLILISHPLAKARPACIRARPHRKRTSNG